MGTRWTKMEDDIFRETYPKAGIAGVIKALADAGFPRSRGQVRNRAPYLDIQSLKPRTMPEWHPFRKVGIQYSEEHLRVMRQYYPTHGIDFTYNLLKEMGLPVPKSIKVLSKACNAYGIYSQFGGRFRKGHIPANKGQKRPGTGKKVFQKGQKSHTWKPVGSEGFRSNYWYVKIEEPNKWVMKHRKLWADAGLTIPPGHILVFKDGNQNNCTLDNLETITRGQHATRNKCRGAQDYALESGNAAKANLKRKGFSANDLRANPELIELETAKIQLKRELKKLK